MTHSFELGPIRPPSEAFSLLIRTTRNCSWNRCKFCTIYKGNKFQLRPVEEIKWDIITAKDIRDEIIEYAKKNGIQDSVRDAARQIINSPVNSSYHNVALWLYGGGHTSFLQDANSLIMRTNELVETLNFLKETFPDINRVTSYGRSKTASKKTIEELKDIHQAGLTRVHIGMETGYDALLEFMDKGVSAKDHIAGGRKLVESGISLSEYVILGMGGREMWREHALETARVLNEICPDYIRTRTLSVSDGSLLQDEVNNGNFTRLTDEEIIKEERLLIENLNCDSQFVSDHIINLLQEVEGNLLKDKDKMLATIDRFLNLSQEEKLNFKIGRRAGTYTYLDDMNDSYRYEQVEKAVQRLSGDNNELNEETIYQLMRSYI